MAQYQLSPIDDSNEQFSSIDMNMFQPDKLIQYLANKKELTITAETDNLEYILTNLPTNIKTITYLINDNTAKYLNIFGNLFKNIKVYKIKLFINSAGVNNWENVFNIIDSISINNYIKKIELNYNVSDILNTLIRRLLAHNNNLISIKILNNISINQETAQCISHYLIHNKTLKKIKFLSYVFGRDKFIYIISALFINKTLEKIQFGKGNFNFDKFDSMIISKMLDINKSLYLLNIPNLSYEVNQKLKNNKQLRESIIADKLNKLVLFNLHLPISNIIKEEFAEFYKNIPINVYE